MQSNPSFDEGSVENCGDFCTSPPKVGSLVPSRTEIEDLGVYVIRIRRIDKKKLPI